MGTAYLLAWPVSFDLAVWTPSPAPAAPTNSALAKVEWLRQDLAGPEGLAVDAEGRVYGGLKDGRMAGCSRCTPMGSWS